MSATLLLVATAAFLASGGAAWVLHRFATVRPADSLPGRLGSRLLASKVRAARRWPLSVACREGAAPAARFAVVAPLVLLKSAVALSLGPLALLLTPLGVMVVPGMRLAAAREGAPFPARSLARVTFWQGTSHLLAASTGTAVAWVALSRGTPLSRVAATSWPSLASLLLASAAAGLIAARIEARDLLADGDRGLLAGERADA